MKKTEYTVMAERERSYWWHLGRLRIFDRQISKLKKQMKSDKLKILNIGCGTGGTIDMLKRHASTLVNVDVSKDAIKFMKSSGYDAMLVDGIELPFDADEFDLIVAFDVLEHIDEDSAALVEWERVLKPGGRVLVSVPAYQWLWSGHDTSLHHHRRYTTANLKKKAEGAELKKQKISYMIVFSFPLVVTFRFLSRFRRKSEITESTSYVEVSPGVNKMFSRLLYIEAAAQKYVNFPFGTSVLGVFSKRED